MANDILKKYGKAASKKVRPLNNKAGSWATNFLKSIGYSSIDALQDIMPATIDVASASAQAGKTLIDNVRNMRRDDKRLSTAMKKNFYIGLASEFWKNSLEDIKSGKLYNRDRLDAFYHEGSGGDDMGFSDMDFGDMGFDEDFDSGEESFANVESTDGSTHASVATKSKKGVDVTNINVSTDLGPDSTVVKVAENQTGAIVDVGTAVIENGQVSTRAVLSTMNTFRTEVTASLSTIDSNIGTISTSIADTLGPHTSLAAKYFDESLKIQNGILEAVQGGFSKTPAVGAADANTKQLREYKNVMDIFSTGGAIDLGAYKELVKKQADRYVDSNLILSQFKHIASEKEGLMMYAKNPLAFITNSLVRGLIPGLLKNSLEQFDMQLKETGVAALNQVSGLRRSDSPILRAIGDIFGVQNKVTKTLDKSAYNKGAVAWSGTDHQALTNVIPTLLRKILANQTGTQEIDFDYEQGVFRTVRDMEKDIIDNKNRLKTSEYGDTLSDFRNFLNKSMGMDDKQKDQASKAMEKFIAKMAMDPYGGFHYRLGGRSGKEQDGKRDDIATAVGSSTNSQNVQLIRAYFTAMEQNRKADLTSIFGSKLQEQRAAYDGMIRSMQQDPLRYNARFSESGLNGENRTDAHLKYNKDTGRLSSDRSRSSMGAGVDQYGRSSVSYLRDIVSMLGTGIPVLPITSSTTGGGRRRRRRRGGSGEEEEVVTPQDRASMILARADDARERLSKDKKKRRDNDKDIAPRYSARTQREIERDAADGKLELSQTDDERNIDQIIAQANAYMVNENTADNKPNFLTKILGKLPESGFKKFLMDTQQKLVNGQSHVGRFVDKADTALFNLVFGDPKKDGRSFFDRLRAGFRNKIIDPLKDKLFGDEGLFKKIDDRLFGSDGFFTKIKQSQIVASLKERFKTIGASVSNFVLGTKNEAGDRENGLLSETYNAFAQIGRDAKVAILGGKDADGNPIPLDQDTSVLGNIKKIFHTGTDKLDQLFGGSDSTEHVGLDQRLVNAFDTMADRFGARSTELMDNLFGPVGEDGKRSYQREFVDGLKDDLKGQSGFVGASAVMGAVGVPILSSHLGLLGSVFLPGGPIGGAIIGAGIGIATKSKTFQNFLFGPEDANGEHTGGLITKEFQDFVSDHKLGMGIGGLAGLVSTYGLLPSFLFPGGPIGGVLGGAAISIAAKSGVFNDLMFGPGGTEDDPTGGLTGKLKAIFGKDKNFKDVAVDAGIGAGIGVLGSFFLPGGPILGALLGAGISVGTATDKFKNWFFGNENEETGRREGGVFGKFTGFMKEKVFDKLTAATMSAQYKLMSFVETNMAIPFKYALQPLLTEAQHAAGVVTGAIKGVFTKFNDALQDHVVKPIGNFLNRFLFNPFKKLLGTVFSGLGSLVGGIISAPFRMMGLMGDVAYGAQKRRGKKSYKNQVRSDSEFGEEATRRREEQGIKFGLFSQRQYNEETGKWERVGRGRIAARFNLTRQLLDREKLRDARFNDDGAFYERGQNVERRKRRKNETKAIKAYYEACEYAAKNGLPKPNRADFLAEYGYWDPGKDKKKKKQKNASSTYTPETSVPESDGRVSDSSTTTSSGSDSKSYEPSSTVDSDIGTVSGSNEYSTSSGTTKTPKTEAPKFDSDGVVSGGKKQETSSSSKSSGSGKTYEPHTKNAGGYSSNDRGSFSWKKFGRSQSNIERDVAKIADSVYGQLNGVGYNVNKIYRTILKNNGLEDGDISGDNNKEYVGFFGRLRTKFNRPFKFIVDTITTPFRAIGKAVDTIKDKAWDFVASIGSAAAGVVEFGKGLFNAAIAIPGRILTGITDFFGRYGKDIVKGVSGVAITIGRGIGAAASGVFKFLKFNLRLLKDILVGGIHVIGDAVSVGAGVISEVFKFGKEKLFDAFSSLGTVVSNFAGHFSEYVGRFFSTAKDIAGGIFGTIKDAAGGIFSNVSNFAGNAFESVKDKFSGVKGFFGGVGEKIGGALGILNPFKWFGKKPIHVIVDSGTLDTVKKVKKVEKVLNVNHVDIIDFIRYANIRNKPTGKLSSAYSDAFKDVYADADNGAIGGVTTSTNRQMGLNLQWFARNNADNAVVDPDNGSIDNTERQLPAIVNNPQLPVVRTTNTTGVSTEVNPVDEETGVIDSTAREISSEPVKRFTRLRGVGSKIKASLDTLLTAAPMLMEIVPSVMDLAEQFSPSEIKGKVKGAIGFFKNKFGREGSSNDTDEGSLDNSEPDVLSGDVVNTETGEVIADEGSLNNNNPGNSFINNVRNTGSNVRSAATGILDRFGRAIKSGASRAAQVARGSRDALLQKFNASREAEEEANYRSSVITALSTTAKTSTEHSSVWNSIFSKKGLITGALILAIPLLMKIGPAIMNFIKGFKLDELASNIVSGFFQGLDEAGGIGGVVNKLLNRGKDVADGVNGETNVAKIDENGQLVYTDDGQIATETENTNLLKQIITPNKTRIDIETGEWSNDRTLTRSSEAYLTRFAVKRKKPIAKGIDLTKKVVTSKPMQKVAEVGKNGLTKLARTASNTTAGKVIGNTLKSGTTVVKTGASKVLDLFITKGREVLLNLASKLAGLGKKFGLKISSSSFDTVLKPFISKIFNSTTMQKFSKKIAEFFAKITGKAAGAVSTAGLLELGFITYGAIEGATNAAAVFEVNEEDVDMKMRAIATVFKGFTNSSIGSILDLIDAIGQEMSMGSIIKSIATWAYGLLSSEEDAATLKKAQDAFTDDYHDYVEKEYEKYKESTEASGQEAMSLDEFKASNLSTTRMEYNSKVNKSLARKVVDGVKGIGGFIKHPIKSIKKGAKSAISAVSGAAGKAKDFVVGGLTKVGKSIGNKAGQVKDFVAGGVNSAVSATKSAIGKATSALSDGFNFVKDNVTNGYKFVTENVVDGYKQVGKMIGDGVVSGLKSVGNLKKKVTDYWTKATKGFFDATDQFKATASAAMSSLRDEIKEHGIFGGITSFFKKDTTKAYYDTQGNYYVLQSNGTYKYFNVHGDELASGIEAKVVQEKLAAGLLTEGELQKDSKAKQALVSITDSAKGIWDNAKTTASNLLDSAKKTASNFFGSIKSTLFGGSGGKGGSDGKVSEGSGEQFNGMPYYSQNDPKYRSKRYKNTEDTTDNGTIAERGCGPAVMASVASKATGKQIDPITMAEVATAGGYSKNVGTTPDYFTNTAKALGIPSVQSQPSAENIKASLSLGNSIIMQGKGKSETSPYTEEGHYVVVTGLEGDKVIINDPRGKQTSGKYNLEDVLNNTTGMWSFGNTKNVKQDKPNGLALGGLGSDNMTEQEKALVGTMLSIEKKDQYTQDSRRTMVGRGYGDCSSTTQWVYKTALGVDPGGYTGAQIQSPLFRDVDSGGNVPNEANLRPGDLLFYRSASGGGHSPTGVSHVEMYIGNGQIMGHGKGTGPFKDTINARAGRYMKARRLSEGGTVQQGAVSDVSGVGTGLVDSTGATTDTTGSTATTSNSSSGVSSIMDLLGGLATAVTNPILEKLGLKTQDTSSGTVSDGTASSTGTMGTGSSINIEGNTTKEKIFNFLTSNGFTANAASGAMGCWEAESGNDPNTLEGYYLVGKDKVPQIISSNESLDQFTTGKLFPAYGGGINKSAYISQGHYYPGFGLAQWTGPRAQRLLSFANSKGANWGELGTQLDFFMNGPGEFKDRQGLLQTLNATSSPEDGATEFLDGFEMSKGWHLKAKGQVQNAKRRANARAIYNMYANKKKSTTDSVSVSAGAGGMGGTSDSKPLDTYSGMEEQNAAILQNRAERARSIVQAQLREKEQEIAKRKEKEAKANKVKKNKKNKDGAEGAIGKTKYKKQATGKVFVEATKGSSISLTSPSLSSDVVSKSGFLNPMTSSLSGKTKTVTPKAKASLETSTEYKPSLDSITEILTQALGALRDIVANTDTTNKGISELNEKEFTANVSVNSNTSTADSKIGSPNRAKNFTDRVPARSADRSEYKLARRIASGVLD